MCQVQGCLNDHKARGYCDTHYRAWRRYGDAEHMRITPKVHWLADHMDYSGDDCLLWPFDIDSNGYGRLMLGGQKRLAHRVMCWLVNGEPPPEKPHTAHWCGNRPCVNPKHLRWATAKENSADALRHGRVSRGSKHGEAVLAGKKAVRSAFTPSLPRRG